MSETTVLHIENAMYIVEQTDSRCTIKDAFDRVIGYTQRLPEAVELCEGLARGAEQHESSN